jgi:hypothetical protein
LINRGTTRVSKYHNQAFNSFLQGFGIHPANCGHTEAIKQESIMQRNKTML